MTKAELKAKLEAGEKLENIFDFIDGQDCLIYKADHFETSDNIIYIPDIYLNDIDVDCTLHGEEIDNVIHHCYTGKDFMEECSNHADLAEELFDFIDWQHPNIQDVLDCYDEDEFEEKYGFAMEEL